MIHHYHPLGHTPALLIFIIAVTLGTGVPISAHAENVPRAADHLVPDDRGKIKIRKEGERDLGRKDKSYHKQANELAKQYRETAKMVASQGGDPKPLLDAAASFENRTKNYKK